MKKREEISRLMSFALRHHPEQLGLEMDVHGWVRVDALIAAVNARRPFDLAALEEIVRTSDKKRFAFSEDHTHIRANQGHSIHVDVELEEAVPPGQLWHGTGRKSLEAIQREGLLPMGRLYVHLSPDRETALKVGRRHGVPALMTVDTGSMLRDGYRFYRSANGVWLTKQVPPQYITFLRV